MIQKMVN